MSFTSHNQSGTLIRRCSVTEGNFHLCAVTRVSINLKPSNRGANFSLSADEDVWEISVLFFPKDSGKPSLQQGLKAPSRPPEEDEEVRATVEAAKTEATRLQDPFISQSKDFS